MCIKSLSIQSTATYESDDFHSISVLEYDLFVLAARNDFPVDLHRNRAIT